MFSRFMNRVRSRCKSEIGSNPRRQWNLQWINTDGQNLSKQTKTRKNITKMMVLSALTVPFALKGIICLAEEEALPYDHGKETEQDNINYSEAINTSIDLVQRIKDEVGSPGIVAAVAVDGRVVWSKGFGYADVENRLPAHSNSVMRIASISKSLTMVVAGQLMETGKLDLDLPINQYVKDFPEKTYEGEKVTITTRQLASHLGGVRHYEKKKKSNKKETESSDTVTNKENTSTNKSGNALEKTKKESDKKETECSDTDTNKENTNSSENALEKKKKETKNEPKSEFDLKEYHIKEKYKTVSDSLKLFKDDPLMSKPGTEYLYSTHGYTLLSAVLEGASGKKFPDLIKQVFKELGMNCTYLDENEPLIYNRARFYSKNKKGRLVNSPYVDNSYKWAGGGFLSTAGDLLKFGNAMLYSSQRGMHSDTTALPGYLKPETMKQLWSAVPNTKLSWDSDGYYGMGWAVIPHKKEHGCCREVQYYVSHTGGAIGASSVLLVHPRGCLDDNQPIPQGVVVAIITNLQSVGLNKTALAIAKAFEKARTGH